MGFELTGKKISFTYKDLVQHIDGSYYDGLGNPINIVDVSSLDINLVNYIKDASLSTGFYWSAGKLYVDVSVVAGGVTKAYVDGSLALRDASILLYASNASVGLAFASNASLGLAGAGGMSRAQIDASYATNVSIGLAFSSNASLGNLSQWRLKDEASMGTLTSRHNKTEASLNIVQATYISDASLNHTTFIWSAGLLDVSVIGGSGVSQSYVDASLINIRGTYIPSASLGTDFYWASGLLEVSVGVGTGDVTKAYVDGSLAIRDASINWLLINKSASTHDHDTRYLKEASLSSEFTWAGPKLYVDVSVVQNGASLIYIDGSLSQRDSCINWLSNNRLDGSLDYTTYEPRISDVSFNYTGDLVTQIVTRNNLGTKIVNFTYDANDDVSIININNYGLWSRAITFEKNIDENVITVHIV